MSKYITTHAELLKLHGRSITCKIEGKYIENAKISVDKDKRISICQNETVGFSFHNGFGFKHSWCFSTESRKYEDDDGDVAEIKLKEETQNLTIGQAIDYMLESEDNVIEYEDKVGKWIVKRRIKDGRLQRLQGKYRGEYRTEEWIYNDYTLDMMTRGWLNIKKHIEPKQKTLKELIEAKEEFSYKGDWYSFNVDGAILNKMSAKAISIELIKELLTNELEAI